MKRMIQAAIQTLLALSVLSIGGARAQDYAIDWRTIDGGGVTFSSGGGFKLSGTIGQQDAGPALTGGGFELTGGFWFATPPGDCDHDGDVDLGDYAGFATCLLGPGGGLGQGCGCFDLAGGGNVDQLDFAEFQALFTKP